MSDREPWFWRYVKNDPLLATLEMLSVLLVVVGMPVSAGFMIAFAMGWTP